ncbi:MAG: RNA polymerase sigma factor [Phycisphaerales bacterium]
MNGEDLLERCRLGDRAAWNVLVERFSGLVYAIARAHGFDEPTCDDVAQTVFAALARGLHGIKNGQALPGWISTTAKRECWRVAALARRSRTLARAEVTDSDGIEERLEAVERAQRVREALRELGGRCEQLLRALFLADGEPDYQAVSKRLGMPIGSIGPTRIRCLAKLANLLEERDRGS